MSVPESMWLRLMENQRVNAPLFRAAHIGPERIAFLACPSCGLEESALFWTVEAQRAHTAVLSCPLCAQTGARYDFRRNRARGPRDMRRIVLSSAAAVLLLSITGITAARYAPSSDDVLFSLERKWQQAGSETGAAGELIRDMLDRGSRAVRRR